VYLAQSVGKYKIGRSKNPAERIEHFDTQMPVRVDEVHRFRADDYVAAERLLHSLLEEHKVKGEWFDLSNSQVGILTNIGCYEDGRFYRKDGVDITFEIQRI